MSMDAVASLLDGPRARRAFLLRSLLEPPWSIGVRDDAPLTVLALVSGCAVIEFDGGAPVALGPGEVAVVQGGPYVVADSPGTSPQVVIHEGQRCTSPDGSVVYAMSDLGVRTWGNSRSGSAQMLTGTYPTRSEVGRRLLAALPPVMVAGSSESVSALIALMAQEISVGAPGQEAMLDRLLDLLLVASVRTWFADPSASVPLWYAAHSDPVVGKALRLIHQQPERPWTVERLAAACGVSRATFARRFGELVGEGPVAYLTSWRIDLAADLLLEPDSTLDSVARRVGYATGFSLSAAFSRVRGVSPSEHRNAG